MQLSEFTYIFLTLCIPFLYYIVRSTSPKKGFSMLFAAIIALNVLLKTDNFSFLGLFFIAFYLYSYGKKESVYYLSLSFISFSAGLINEISINTLKSIISGRKGRKEKKKRKNGEGRGEDHRKQREGRKKGA